MARTSRKDEETKARRPGKKAERGKASGVCLCGAVTLEIDTPVVWAWHDHSASSRRAHGAVYATYVGSWRSKFRVARGADKIARFVDETSGNARSFCSRCGTPLIYERKRSPKMVNLPRSLFAERTGREPRYHIAIDELQDWIYTGASLAPLKGYPGVMWERSRKKRGAVAPLFDPDF
jgi:hypothetical protein